MAEPNKSPLSGIPLYLAVLVVVTWLAALIWLAVERNASEVEWARLTFLLGSIEAVAFGAAGALFGTQIQRQRVNAAEERAGKAEKEADENKQEANANRHEADANRDAAAKGKALALAVKAEAGQPAGSQSADGRLAASKVAIPKASLRIADELFPD